jgi:hypothetical protein
VSGPDSTVGPVLGELYTLTASEGGTIGQGVALISLSDSLPHSHILFPLQNSVVSNLKK